MASNEAVVIGSKNTRLRRLRRLSSRTKARSEERAFVVDGPVLVADALRSELVVQEIFAGPGTLDDHGLWPLIGEQIPVFEAQVSVLESALDPVNPRPLAAVVSTPEWTLADLRVETPVLVAVELRDPGNMGTIIRTAEAAGMAGVIVVGDSVDHLSPKVVRASAGSVLRHPVIRFPDPATAYEQLRESGRSVQSAVVDDGAASYDAVDLSQAAIVVGNEPHGLSAETIRLGDGQITIPLSSAVESLNVAAAASVLCFEAARQRRAAAAGGGAPSEAGNSLDR